VVVVVVVVCGFETEGKWWRWWWWWISSSSVKSMDGTHSMLSNSIPTHHQNNNFPIKFIAAASTLFRVFPIHLSLFIQRRTRRRRCWFIKLETQGRRGWIESAVRSVRVKSKGGAFLYRWERGEVTVEIVRDIRSTSNGFRQKREETSEKVLDWRLH
jgi:hypothetical protein